MTGDVTSDKVLVTIDGPSASGKTTVSRELARHFGWSWVSTGAFYRAIAYAVKDAGVNLSDEEQVVGVIDEARWTVNMEKETTEVLFDGEDVSGQVFREQYGDIASQISALPGVRAALLAAQRACYQRATKGLVAEGRDCGTVVFPQALVKIYLTANEEARLERRAKEEGLSVGEAGGLAQTQRARDERDHGRKTAPMQAAQDALLVDTSGVALDEVVQLVVSLVEKRISAVF